MKVRLRAPEQDTLLATAVAASLIAAAIHAYVTPDHFAEWWAMGAFFAVVACAQLASACFLAKRATRSVVLAAILGNALVIAIWVASRATDLSFGPHPEGHVDVGIPDIVATLQEVAIVVALTIWLWRRSLSHDLGVAPARATVQDSDNSSVPEVLS